LTRAVRYFGKEAATFSRRLADWKIVRLEFDF
jgi:hypothetical protein